MTSTSNQDQESPYYDRETLYREVRKEPMIHVAKRYGVSDVAPTKTCKKLRVPKRGLGYWAKKAHGHEVETPPLPEFSDPPKILRRRANTKDRSAAEPAEERLAPEAFQHATELSKLEDNQDMKIDLPDDLSDIHPFVRNTHQNLIKRAKDRYRVMDYGRIDSSGVDTFKVVVSPDSVDRALRILQAMCDAFSLRAIGILKGEEKHYAVPSPKIRIMEVDLEFRLFEPATRILKSDSESRSTYKQYDYVPTGELLFELDGSSYRSEYRMRWRDTKKRKLEDQLNEIMKGLYTAAAWHYEWNAQAKKREAEWAIEEAKRQEAARIARIEAHRVTLIERGVEQHAKYLAQRRYLDAVRAEAINRAGTVDQESEIGMWLDWAERYVESMNPLKGNLPTYDVDDTGSSFDKRWPSRQ